MFSDEQVHRVPLKYFTDIEKLNFPVKIDLRFKLHLETEIKKLFQFRKVIARAGSVDPDAKVIFKEPHQTISRNNNGFSKDIKDGNSKISHTENVQT